ncbi:leucine-rich repeat domain-containing protein, partial [Candidatus Woesearchaeota archaeon]|nr:leucine-rich repeat domain-containing protein [Candidatus Woesearchaeota archaeon]
MINPKHQQILSNIENQLSIILSQGNDFYIDVKKNYGVDEQGNVVWLSLCDKNISDVSEIAKLLTIKLLDLSQNSIVDISPLTNLKNLEKLFIYDNSIKDISALQSLQRLETINVVGNPIESIYRTKQIFQDINLIYSDALSDKKIIETTQKIEDNENFQFLPEIPFSKQEFVEKIVIDGTVPYEYSKYYTKKGVVELIKEIKIEKCENGFFLVLKDKKLFVLGKDASHVVSTHIEQLFELCGIKYPILEDSHWEYFFFSNHLSEEEFNDKKISAWRIGLDINAFNKPEPNELDEVIDLSHIDMTYINKVREMETADHAKFLIKIPSTGNIIKREGPPGTGKTYLASKYAAYAHFKEMKVIMISFTNAAVSEMRNACPFIDWKNIQTIYVYCRKLLGSRYNARLKEDDGTVQENLEENVDEEGKKKRKSKKDRDSWSDLWNKEYGELYPFSVDDKKESQADDIGHRAVNSSVYGYLSEKVSILRHRRINPEKWHEVVEEEGWDNEEWENLRLKDESFLTAILTFYKYLIDFNKKHNLCDNIDWLEEVLKLDQ